MINVGIHHFSRDAIRVFNDDSKKGTTSFVNYFLPGSLSKEVYPSLKCLTDDDKFDCTFASRRKRHKDCMKKAKDCLKKGEVFSCKGSCNRYMNVPFVPVEKI